MWAARFERWALAGESEAVVAAACGPRGVHSSAVAALIFGRGATKVRTNALQGHCHGRLPLRRMTCPDEAGLEDSVKRRKSLPYAMSDSFSETRPPPGGTGHGGRQMKAPPVQHGPPSHSQAVSPAVGYQAFAEWGRGGGQGGFLLRSLVDGAGSYSVAHRAGLLPTELTGMWGWMCTSRALRRTSMLPPPVPRTRRVPWARPRAETLVPRCAAHGPRHMR